jgi:ABC-type branched-subunit amino acid transport system ATPase component
MRGTLSLLLNLERVSKHSRVAGREGCNLSVNEGDPRLIGPNGAGETTLSAITGVYRPEQGVWFTTVRHHRDQTASAPPPGIAHVQIVRPFMQLTVMENVTTGRSMAAKRSKIAAALRLRR